MRVVQVVTRVFLRWFWYTVYGTGFHKLLVRLLYFPSIGRMSLLEGPNRRWYDRIDDTVILGALPFRSQAKQVCPHTHTQTRLHLQTRPHTLVHTHTHIHKTGLSTHTHTHVHIHTYTYTRTHTCLMHCMWCGCCLCCSWWRWRMWEQWYLITKSTNSTTSQTARK